MSEIKMRYSNYKELIVWIRYRQVIDTFNQYTIFSFVFLLIRFIFGLD